jgi:hypothetical protein
MAAPGGDSIYALLPVPNLRGGGIDWAREADGLRDALVEDYETTFGLTGLDASVVVEHRMTPRTSSASSARLRQRVRDRADAAPVGLLPPAQPRPRRRGRVLRRRRDPPRARHPRRAAQRRGHRGLVLADHPAPRDPGGPHERLARRSLAEARDTTRRVARTFSLACRLLPRELRDDVYLLYLVFRTLDDLVDDGMPEAGARDRRRCARGATPGPS